MISLPNPSKMTYSEEVQTKIDELKAENYYDEDMFDFINQYGNNSFLKFYEQYVQNSEDYCYEAVDAFIEEFGLYSLVGDNFQDAYRGQYDSKADYAESYVSDCYVVDLPGFLEINWEASFNNLDVVFNSNGYVFDTQF